MQDKQTWKPPTDAVVEEDAQWTPPTDALTKEDPEKKKTSPSSSQDGSDVLQASQESSSKEPQPEVQPEETQIEPEVADPDFIPTPDQPLEGLGGEARQPISVLQDPLEASRKVPEENPFKAFERIQGEREGLDKSHLSDAPAIDFGGKWAKAKEQKEEEISGKMSSSQAQLEKNLPKVNERLNEMFKEDFVIGDALSREFITKDTDGMDVPDAESLSEYAKEKAEEMGLPEDGYAWKHIWNKAKDHIAYKIIQPRVEKEAEAIYKEKHGTSIKDAGSSDEIAKYADIQGIQDKAILEFKSFQDEQLEQADQYANELVLNKYGAEPDEVVAQMNERNEQNMAAIEAQYGRFIQGEQFTGTEEQFAEYQEVNKQARQAYEQEFSEVLATLSSAEAEANRRYKRTVLAKGEEIERGMKSIMEDKRKLIDPLIQERIGDAYNQAYKKVAGDDENAKNLVERSFGENLTSTMTSAFSGSIKAMGTTFGNQRMQEWGDYMEKHYHIGDVNMEEWSDWLDLSKAARSTGNLIGTMGTSMIPAIAAGAVTGGLGASPFVSGMVASIAGFGGESSDLAGRMYDDTFRETGDAAKAAERSKMVFDSQMILAPTYMLEMLPVFGDLTTKFTKGLFSKVLLGAGIEYTTETFLQEFPQNSFEKAIREDEDLAKVFKHMTWASLEETAKNTVGVVFMGGAGQANQHFSEKLDDKAAEKKLKANAKTMAAKVALGRLSDNDAQQAILKMVAQKGVRFADAVISSTWQSGEITYEQAGPLLANVKTAESVIGKVREYNLSDVHSYVLSSMFLKHEKAEQEAEREKSGVIQKLKQKKAASIQADIDAMFSKGEAHYATLTYANGDFAVLTVDEARKKMKEEGFAKTFEEGDLKMEAFGPEAEQFAEELNAVLDVKEEAPKAKEKAKPTPEQAAERQETLKKREEAGIEPEVMKDAPKQIMNTVLDVAEGKPVSKQQAKSASDWLYKEFKKVKAMKGDENAPISQDKVQTYLDNLSSDIEALENYEQPKAEVKKEEKVELVKKKDENLTKEPVIKEKAEKVKQPSKSEKKTESVVEEKTKEEVAEKPKPTHTVKGEKVDAYDLGIVPKSSQSAADMGIKPVFSKVTKKEGLEVIDEKIDDQSKYISGLEKSLQKEKDEDAKYGSEGGGVKAFTSQLKEANGQLKELEGKKKEFLSRFKAEKPVAKPTPKKAEKKPEGAEKFKNEVFAEAKKQGIDPKDLNVEDIELTHNATIQNAEEYIAQYKKGEHGYQKKAEEKPTLQKGEVVKTVGLPKIVDGKLNPFLGIEGVVTDVSSEEVTIDTKKYGRISYYPKNLESVSKKPEAKKAPAKKEPKKKEAKKDPQIEAIAKDVSMKASDIRGLYQVARDIFGQTQDKALASAIVMDAMIGEMASREGISKEEMYDKIEFRKGDKDTEKALREGNEAIFQGKKEVEESKNLIAFHNLNALNVHNIDNIGGIPMPSLAVTKKDIPFESYGEISLIADKSMVDPKTGGRTFASDIYSPRYPSITYDANYKQLQKRFGQYESLLPENISRGTIHSLVSEIEERGLEEAHRNSLIQAAYLQETQGKLPRIKNVPKPKVSKALLEHYKKQKEEKGWYDSLDAQKDEEFQELWLDEQRKYYESKLGKEEGLDVFNSLYSDGIKHHAYHGIINKLSQAANPNIRQDELAFKRALEDKTTGNPLRERKFKKWIDNQFKDIDINEKLFTGYDRDGSRKYLNHTVENVMRILKKGDLRGGEAWNYGAGSLRSAVVPKFKSVQDIKDSENKLITDEEFEKIKDEANEALIDLAHKISKTNSRPNSNPFMETDRVTSIIEEAAKTGRYDFSEYGYNMTPELYQEVRDFLEKLRNMPTTYFESKPKRVVDLSEFKAALVPKNVDKKAEQILKDKGVKIVKYDQRKETGRKEALDKYIEKTKDILFQDDTTPEIWKSTAQEGLSKVQQKNATPEQWVKMIADKGGKGTLQELEWIGLSDFLNDWKKSNKAKSVPKEVVEQYIKDNQIEVVDVTRGKPEEKERATRGAISDIELVDDTWYVNIGETEITVRKFDAETENEAIDHALDEYNDEEYGPTVDNLANTKYSQYVLEGGENYREVLLTLPDVGLKAIGEYNSIYGDEQIFLKELNIPTEADRAKAKEFEDRLKEAKEKLPQDVAFQAGYAYSAKTQDDYISTHWDGQKNILAHLRMNERTLPNGERVLFLEEMQSDWAQGGKKDGFKRDLNQEEKDRIEEIEVEKGEILSNIPSLQYLKEILGSLDEMSEYNEYTKKSPAHKLRFMYSVIEPNMEMLQRRLEGKFMPEDEARERYMDNARGRVDYWFKNARSVPEVTDKQLLELFELYKKDATKQGTTKVFERGLGREDITINDLVEYDKIHEESLTIVFNADKANSVPDMPYKKTDQWVGMAMRRVMKMAAEQGMDRIAWVTGEQAADRFDLSKQIPYLQYDVVEDSDGNIDSYVLRVPNEGGAIQQELDLTESELESHVGKEVAQKIINQEGNINKDVKSVDGVLYGGKKLVGNDLKVGGEGMKAFYNSILPKVAKKEAQRFDKKARIEVVDMLNTDDMPIDTYAVPFDKAVHILQEIPNKESLKDGDWVISHKGEYVSTIPKNKAKTEDDALAQWVSTNMGTSEITKQPSKELSIPITPEMRMNLNGAIPLFQGAQGAMLAEDGNYVIYALTDPNVSTPLHELSHVFEKYLSEDEVKKVLAWTGHRKWDTKTSERFARGFERYLKNGKAPTPQLQKIFDKFRSWLTDIYETVKNSEVNIPLNDDMIEIYSKMLGAEEVQSFVEEMEQRVADEKAADEKFAEEEAAKMDARAEEEAEELKSLKSSDEEMTKEDWIRENIKLTKGDVKKYADLKAWEESKQYYRGIVDWSSDKAQVDTAVEVLSGESGQDISIQDVIDWANGVAAERSTTGSTDKKIPAIKKRKQPTQKKAITNKTSVGDMLRKLSENVGGIKLDTDPRKARGFIIPPQLWNLAIAAAEKTLDLTATGADKTTEFVDFIVDFIKKSKEYRRAKHKKAISVRSSVLDKMGITQDEFDKMRKQATEIYKKQAKKEADKDLKTKLKDAKKETARLLKKYDAEEQETRRNYSPRMVDAGGKSVEKTVAGRRAYRGNIRDEVKDFLEGNGLDRIVVSQEERSVAATAFIDQFGENNAIEAVREYDVRGAQAASILAQTIKNIDQRMSELTATDVDELDRLSKKQADVIGIMDREAFTGGNFNSQLAYEYADADLGFNVDKIISKWEEDFSEEIPKDVEDKFRKWDEERQELKVQLTDAIKRAEAAEADAAIKNIRESVGRAKEGGKTYKAKAKDLAAQFRKLKTKPIKFRDADGNEITITENAIISWNDIIEIGAKAIELTGDIADGIKAMKDALADADWFTKLAKRDQDAVVQQLEDHFSADTAEEVVEEQGIKIPKAVIRELVEGGIDNIEDLVEAVKEFLIEDYPDVTDREIRDAITGYGKTVNMDKTEVGKEIRRLKEIGRIISQLEDVANKQRPLRSGAQRKPFTAEQKAEIRRLKRQLREAMKDLPIDSETEARQLATALDVAKNRLRNQIEDLDREIKEKKVATRKPRDLKGDAKLKQLTERRDALKAIHDETFKDDEKLTQQKINAAVSATKKSIDEYERRIKEGDLYPEKAPPLPETPELKALRAKKDKLKETLEAMRRAANPKRTEAQKALDRVNRSIEKVEERIAKKELTKRKKTPIVSAEISAAKKVLAEQRKLLRQMQEDAGIIEDRRLELAKNRVNSRIKDFERRLLTGDFSKREAKPLIQDTELAAIQGDLLRIKEEYEKAFYKRKLQNRTAGEIRWDRFWDGWALLRVIKATAEASFILIQGGTQTIAHPKNALKALKNSWDFFKSERHSEQWIRHIKSQEFYPVMKRSKLALTEPHAELKAREELFYSEWFTMVWNILGKPLNILGEKAYDKFVAANPVQAIERAAVGYLDTHRALRFLQVMEKLESEGKPFHGNEQEYKDVADVINTLTGRASLGKAELFSDNLTKVFFSPRNWASQFKTATPYAFIHFGKMRAGAEPWRTSTAQKMVLGDLSKRVAFTMSMLTMAAVYLNNDDDDETGVEFDPRSSDFLKIRLGRIRIDPWGGMIQQVILTARMLMDVLHDVDTKAGLKGRLSKGGMKKDDGSILPLGMAYKTRNKWEAMESMAINKLSPTAHLLYEYLTKSEDAEGNWETPYGQEYEILESVEPYPIYWGLWGEEELNVINELREGDPSALDGMLLFYAFLGGGVSVYEKKDSKSKKGEAETALDEEETRISEERKAIKDEALSKITNSGPIRTSQVREDVAEKLERDLKKVNGKSVGWKSLRRNLAEKHNVSVFRNDSTVAPLLNSFLTEPQEGSVGSIRDINTLAAKYIDDFLDKEDYKGPWKMDVKHRSALKKLLKHKEEAEKQEFIRAVNKYIRTHPKAKK